MILIALVISLVFHELGHAWVAKYYGDNTAQMAGRLTLNPVSHIDPVGLAMVVFVGFGYAKPVPVNPRNFTSKYAELFVAAAGPAMNLLLAFLTINIYAIGLAMGVESFAAPGPTQFFLYLAQINLLLMIFNLLPIGALDGHYILPYFLPRRLAFQYRDYNARYGNMVLIGLLVLTVMGLPIFSTVFSLSQSLLPFLLLV